MSVLDFQGWYARRIVLPGDDVLICYYYRNHCKEVSLHDENHNIFRLDPSNKVIWQVRRDDRGKLINWESMHRHARERGQDGARWPFMEFVLKRPDGSTNLDAMTGCPPEVAIWEPGDVIWLRGSAYQDYELDPESGIALNVTEGRPRPW